MSKYDYHLPEGRFNPLGIRLYYLMQDTSIRQIILYGGSSSGKSYSVAQMLLVCVALSGENALVMRKVGASISKSIYEDFKVAAEQLGMKPVYRFVDSVKSARHSSGARIDFAGLDDPEKIKGISNYRWVFMDEWSEFDEADYKQIRKRLRGKVGQQIVMAFNPIRETHWIKKNVIDAETWVDERNDAIEGRSVPSELCMVKSVRHNAEKSIINPRTREIETHAPDTVLIQTTYLNNFWVVGSPDGTYGYYDEQCVADFEKDRVNDPDYYQVYALGEWGVIRTGSEFFSSFNRGRHCADVAYDPTLPVHVSVDNNRLPYIAITLWQASMADGIQLRQIGECPAGNPDNTARKAAVLLAKRLRSLGYDGKVHLHGDATTRNGNTIDDEGRSFLDLFISSLQGEGYDVEDCVGANNPSVAMSGEFINAVWDGIIPGLGITIGNDCNTSVEDYLSVQKDPNGAILKTKVKNKATGQTYEEHGHISDTLRYVVVDLMRDEFLKFSNRRKRNLYARDGYIHFYNPGTQCAYTQDMAYCMPNVGGKFAMVRCSLCGDKWHVRDVAFIDTTSTEDIKARLSVVGCPDIVIECSAAYYAFVRELRAEGLSVRVARESADIDRRIAATSDFVRGHVLFNERASVEDDEYAAFMTSLLDYNADSRNKEASAVLSGFVHFAEKTHPIDKME